jgi:hypothetical protein
MVPPIFSSTPVTPRSDEKTANARTMNSRAIKTVSHFRLMVLLQRIANPVSMAPSSPLRLCASGAVQ